jgi:hypothetical protein
MPMFRAVLFMAPNAGGRPKDKIEEESWNILPGRKKREQTY